MEPAVADGLGRGVGVVVICAEHVVALDQDLAVGVDLDGNPRQGASDGTDLDQIGGVDGGRRGGLRQPVSL